MIQKEFCQNCHLKHDCREIYRQLGHAACPSVVRKVIVAFLLPPLVFIISLAFFDNFFAGAWSKILDFSQDGNSSNMVELKTAVNFLMAMFTTSISVLLLKVLNKRLHKDF